MERPWVDAHKDPGSSAWTARMHSIPAGKVITGEVGNESLLHAEYSPKPLQVSGHFMEVYGLGYRRLIMVLLSLLLVACEARPPPGETGLQDTRTPTFTGEGVKACLYCHAGAFNQAIAASPHGDANNPATPYGQHGCESCHGPGSFHVSRAYGGKGRPGLITFGSGAGAAMREVQLAACESCHHNEAAEPAKIGYRESAHDSRYINCSTCHAVHAEDEPLSSPGYQAAVCLECHRSQRTAHPEVRGRPVDFDRQACSACHDLHPATGADENDFDF